MIGKAFLYGDFLLFIFIDLMVDLFVSCYKSYDGKTAQDRMGGGRWVEQLRGSR
jgi:hypothetical protein